MQDRIGPKRAWARTGSLQTVADAVKLMFKEAIYPGRRGQGAVHPRALPGGGGRVPVLRGAPVRLAPAGASDLNVGLFYVVAVSSLSTVGLIMAGWASNNKYALFGAMRSAAQIVSYEIPAVMSLLDGGDDRGQPPLQDIVLGAGGRPAATGSSSATSR